jgi:L-asparaginase
MADARIIVTGGTIDKHYGPLTGELGFSETHVHRMLKQARLTVDVTVEELLMVDSLDMTEEQRMLIVRACEAAPEKHIIIIHGTDTMPETARAISTEADVQAIRDKAIVLTGAMIPYNFVHESDALFNLGTAMAYAQILSPGVYVSMNGRYFEGDKVRKDKGRGVFVELATER